MRNLEIVLVDQNELVVSSWLDVFAGAENFRVIESNILSVEADALVAPTNSFGVMDGGLDLVINQYFDSALQTKLQEQIRLVHRGELLVGSAEVVLMTMSGKLQRVICAPTMRTPQNVASTMNAYLAMRAVLIAISDYNASSEQKINSVAIPGLCSGIGRMPVERSAKQMKAAYDQVIKSQCSLKTLSVAHTEELNLKY